MISIKDVTKETGISVRTLRYYDEIELLTPAGKTEGGHRLYGEKELKKLQEIQFLKSIGFGLKDIKNILAGGDWDWAQGLKEQLTFILKEKAKIIEMESTIKGLINSFTIDGQVDLIHLQKLIHLYQNNDDQRVSYRKQIFNEKEKELFDLLPNMNSGDPDSVEWVSLLAQLKHHKEKGVHAAEVQSIVRRIYDKTNETFGADDDFYNKIWDIRKSPEESEKLGFYPLDQDILEFFEAAWEVFEAELKEKH